MNKKSALILFGISLLAIIGYFVVRSNSASTAKTGTPVLSANTTEIMSSIPQSITPADKIEVVHFHGTEQCVSCITVGKYALQTIKDRFPDEYESGKIVFKEINGELPENRAIVIRYQARGSSLFVNAIRGDKDDIAEDTTVWRLVNSETQYTDYFAGRLNTLLGK